VPGNGQNFHTHFWWWHFESGLVAEPVEPQDSSSEFSDNLEVKKSKNLGCALLQFIVNMMVEMGESTAGGFVGQLPELYVMEKSRGPLQRN
jgi:hypothetical protein